MNNRMENQLMLQDSKLVNNYLNGDESAFKTLLDRYKSKVFSTILVIVGDRYVAEDLTQETFIKVIKTIKSDKYNEQGKFAPWICRIAHNKAIDHVRRAKKLPTITMENGKSVFDFFAFDETNYETKQIEKETTTFLKELIKRLPETQREVLVLRHYADMSFKEIAEVTGVSINTALGRMRYAIMNLKKELVKLNKYDKDFYPTGCD